MLNSCPGYLDDAGKWKDSVACDGILKYDRSALFHFSQVFGTMASAVIRLTIVCVFVVVLKTAANAVSLINFSNVSIWHRTRIFPRRQSVDLPSTRMNPQWSFIHRPTHWSSLPSVWRFFFSLFCSPFLPMPFAGNWKAPRHPHRRRPVRRNRPQSRSPAIDYPLPSSVHRRVVRVVLCRVPMPITGHAWSLLLLNGHWRNLIRPSSVLIQWTTIITIRITKRDRCVYEYRRENIERTCAFSTSHRFKCPRGQFWSKEFCMLCFI